MIEWFMDPANTELVENIVVIGILVVAAFVGLFACGVLSGILRNLIELNGRVERIKKK